VQRAVERDVQRDEQCEVRCEVPWDDARRACRTMPTAQRDFTLSDRVVRLRVGLGPARRAVRHVQPAGPSSRYGAGLNQGLGIRRFEYPETKGFSWPLAASNTERRMRPILPPYKCTLIDTWSG